MSAILPEVGSTVFCRQSDLNGKPGWFERKVLGHSDHSSDLEPGSILVDSAVMSHSIEVTGSFVRKDSEEGRKIQQHSDYFPL